MSRQESRRGQMLRNAEHLHTLAVLETVLDEELDRLESEHDWCCRKYVYLEALDSDSAHLRQVAITIQKSRNLIDTLRSLLDDTFEEKLIFMSEVRNEQLQWRIEDSHLRYHRRTQQHNHHQHLPLRTRTYHTGHPRLSPVKRNKKFTLSVKRVKSKRSHTYLTSLTSQSQMSINLSKKCKEAVKICNRSKSKIKKTRSLFPQKYQCNKKSIVSQIKQSKISQISESHYADTRHQLQLIQREQNYVLSNITNEITRYRQIISDSPVMLHPPVTNQPIEMEDFIESIRRHIWRYERSSNSDLFCFGEDLEDETLHIDRAD